MNNVNKIIAEDIDFSKLLFELEQVNLRLLVELKQSRGSKGKTAENSAPQSASAAIKPLRSKA